MISAWCYSILCISVVPAECWTHPASIVVIFQVDAVKREFQLLVPCRPQGLIDLLVFFFIRLCFELVMFWIVLLMDLVWILIVDGLCCGLDMFYSMPAWTAEEVSLSDLSFTSVVE